MSDTGNEWQVARRRKRQPKKTPQLPATFAGVHEELDARKLINRIRDTESELRCEEFWENWKKELLLVAATASGPAGKNMTAEYLTERGQQLDCVCYGLGSFSSCAAARYQLAMLLLLLDVGQIPLQNCFVYDPIFSSGEKDVLRQLGLTVLTENEEGKHLAAKPTLFYLMHCGKALYNNLLWRNWSIQGLLRLKIIGNSFVGIRERMIQREFQREYSYISKAVDLCEEKMLPCPSRMIDVFSDTAVISFPFKHLAGVPRSSWTKPPEPMYTNSSDLEIILKKTQS